MRATLTALLTALAVTPPASAADTYTGPVTRLFFQDHEKCALMWADVTRGDGGALALGEPARVAGFPKLDVKRHKLVQMRRVGGLLLVGVRDDADGALRSGWVLLRTGVRREEHGDHAHWFYDGKPAVIDSRLDKKQGNPAHVYVYNGKFYVANDRLNGFTVLDPKDYPSAGGWNKPTFHKGGGNHITLAVAADGTAYSTWIDGGGPNKGRVDVVPPAGPGYTFHLPAGVIHGAAANCGRIFFAPANGVDWVRATPRCPAGGVKVHHIDLGQDGGTPRRTGAFVNHGPYVLFVTGGELCLLDARKPSAGVKRIGLGVKKLNRAITPVAVTTLRREPFALVFHDHDARVKAGDFMSVVRLDADGDGDCADATLVQTVTVGQSKVTGHFGHHAVAADADGEWVFVTNPGDGTVVARVTSDWAARATFRVGGVPTAVIAHGGRDFRD